MPAYYAMLAVVALLGAATARSVIVSAIFMRDYGLGTTSFILGHTWSLGVEEKFYLLWPVAAASLSRRQLTWLGLVVMATLPAVRVATYVFAPTSRDLITIMFHTRADTLAAGCLLAILFEADSQVAPRRTRLKARLSSRPAAAAAAIVLFAASPILTACFGGAYLLPIGLTVDGVSASVLVACSVYNPPAFLAMLLNARLPVMVGVMSYSLYLWQQMAFDPVTGWLPSLGYRLIFLAAAAAISYYGIERPCTNLRRRWHRGALAS
jgi:peptidoglycan/LPS O-acetylase OafA/YrhL